MESNNIKNQDEEVEKETEGYVDPEPNKVVTKKDLNKMVWTSLFLQASFNYERMQSGGWVYSLIPGLKKIHTNKKDLSTSLTDHMEFFNTHPFPVTFIQGVILAMEENKEDRDTIRGIKVALMGPFGGIGDALFYLTLLPITGGIAASLSQQGNIFGPILFILAFNLVHFGVRFGLMHFGHSTGTSAISSLKTGTKKVSRAASIVGLMVVGGLIPSFVNFSLNWELQAGEIPIDIQTEVLDAVMPSLLPLLYTLFCYWLIKRGRSPLIIIGITVVVGLVGSFFGIM